MGDFERIESSTRVISETLCKELLKWKSEIIILDDHIRKVSFTRGVATLCIILCLKEGEEGFEVHADYRGGFCKDDYRGFSSKNAEKAIKATIARATIIEELERF